MSNLYINEEHTLYKKEDAIKNFNDDKEINVAYWKRFISDCMNLAKYDGLCDIRVIDFMYDKLTSKQDGVGMLYATEKMLKDFEYKASNYFNEGKWDNAQIYYRRVFGRDIEKMKN